MKVKVSDYIASFIASQGVQEIFLIPGGVCTSLVDSIARNKKLIYISNHHEQACAMAAESYSRVTNNLGVCLVTVGPGVTNTITGIAGAWLDSIPTLYISGQVKRDNMIVNSNSNVRQLGVQELDATKLLRSITKYSAVVMDPDNIKYHLQKAIYIARTGRPGPVHLDIPSDVQDSIVEIKSLKNFHKNQKKNTSRNKKLVADIKKLLILLKKSKRPVIFAGHGIRLAQGQKEFLKLINKLNIPILTSMSAHDLIPTQNNMFIGRPGVFGDRAGNFAIQNCDLLISIGARHHLWNIGYDYKALAPAAKKVIVDIDKTELNKKTVVPDLPICTDAKKFIQYSLKMIDFYSLPDISEWIKICRMWKQKYPVVLPKYKHEKKYVNSYYFTEVLSTLLPENEIIITGVGTSFTGTLQCFKIKKGQRLISNVGCAAMGYDLPAAIGACFGNKKKPIILITGEGSIMLNLQELQTIAYYNLPIKIFLLNNKGYLAIKNTQNAFFRGRLAAVDEQSGVNFPNFKKIAIAFGLDYKKINNHNKMKAVIQNVLKTRGPIICEINMSPNQPLYPKVYSQKNSDGSMQSKSLENMYPFLDTDEFLSNIIINK